MNNEWEKLSLSDAVKKLGSKKEGITIQEAAARLKRNGPNEIKTEKKISPLRILLSQFSSPLILILIAAALISFFISYLPESDSQFIDALLILIIVLAVGISGFFQDWKAEKAIEALKRMSTPNARVIRGGKEMEIPASDLVTGDVVLLEGGDVIPADGKIVAAFDIMLDESILTGESKAVRKKESNLLFMNTSMISGRCSMLVFGTGMHTEVGKIAKKMGEIKETKTSFQIELGKFSEKIFWFVLAISAVMFTVGYFKYGIYPAFLTAISLAVAAIPEGLPAVVTLALALGAKYMVQSKALIRKLPVVESIGSVNVICTDKTGTLTENRMSVTEVYFDDVVYETRAMNTNDAKKMETMMLCGTLCNNTRTEIGEKGEKKIIGDQTEVAIVNLAEKFGFIKDQLDEKYKRINEISFTSKRKLMSVVYKHGGKRTVFSKGAPEMLLDTCSKIYSEGKVKVLDDKTKKKILKQNKEFAGHALRVLGFAYKESSREISEKEIEKNLIFIGLEGMLDPPRPEAKKAIEECKSAGIRVIMITGDNADTANAIANNVGLDSKGSITGMELEKMKDDELEKRITEGTNVFARTSPFDKLRILRVLQKTNRVAMTGDGVNDTLALKKADVGIAMGERGTDVAKEASDIILMDDNFATIKNAVKEGRRIFDNIQKFVNYLLSSNFAEVFVIFIGTLIIASDQPILLPVHILWINLLTDGMPALALGVDPASPDIMKRNPRGTKKGILDRKTMINIVAMGLNIGILLLLVFFANIHLGVKSARTALFMGFVLYEFMRIAVIRHQEELSFFDNRILLLAMGASIILQLAVIYTPLNIYFDVVPLQIAEWMTLIIFGAAGWFSSLFISWLIRTRFK